jgi:hypothetical protein
MWRHKNIPTVEEYSHWNEEAQQVWYLENKYDMENPYEWVEEEDYFPEDEN